MKLNRILHHALHSLEYGKNIGYKNLLIYYFDCIIYTIAGRGEQQNDHSKLQTFRVKKYNTSINLRKRSADLMVFGNVCLTGEYDFAFKEFHNIKKVSLIVDAGANIGILSKIFAAMYPEATIVSLEPDKDNFRMLKNNTADISKVISYQEGLWNKVTFLKIFRGKQEYAFRLAETNNSKEANVKVIDINTILKRVNKEKIDILKMDIEGSEYFVFDESSRAWIEKVGSILIEVHNNLYPDCFEKINSLMIKNGFYCVNSNKKNDSVYLYINKTKC